jgi:hypothetical protein
MSASSAEAGASILYLTYAKSIHPPFLRRNVRKTLFSLMQMGSTLSMLSPSIRAPKVHGSAMPPDGHDAILEEGTPLAKRRRTEISTEQDDNYCRRPLGQVSNESKIYPKALHRSNGIDPVNFYGKPRVVGSRELEAKPPGRKVYKGTAIQTLVPSPLTSFERALKIDFLGITSSEDADSREPLDSIISNNPVDIECDCFVSIFWRNEGREFDLKCRHVNRYTLRLAIDKDGKIERHFLGPEDKPFVFSTKDFYVNRNLGSSRNKGIQGLGKYLETTPGFADSYRLQINIEPVGFNKYWPCLDLQPSLDGVATETSLYSNTSSIFGVFDQSRSLPLTSTLFGEKKRTSYELQLDISWSQANTLVSHKAIELQKISTKREEIVIAVPEDIVTTPSKKRKFEQTTTPDSPNIRSQRHRPEVATYNLKTLSAQAQGHSPRKQQAITHAKDGSEQGSRDGLTVSYNFGKADAADAQVRPCNVVLGLGCPFCACANQNLQQLRLHLCNEHSKFKFSLRRSNPPRISFFVELVSNYTTSNGESQKGIQLGKPLTLFDLEKYLSGDKAWVKSRQGPQHNLKAHDSICKIVEPSSSSTSGDSLRSSPDTSHYSDGQTVLEPIRMTITSRKVVKVPKTRKPLYHTITKKVLRPGDDLSSSDDEKDEAWLRHKHRDIIHDFSDIGIEEKEYINRWNPFITEKQYSIRTYLPQAIAEFMENNKTWLLEKDTRKAEFVKQCQTFILRGDITERHLDGLLVRLKMEKSEIATKMDIDIDDEQLPKPRGELDCVCGQRVALGSSVPCRGKATNVSCSLSIALLYL